MLDVRVRLPLDRFELDVELTSEARMLGVFGASGCGKTSLLESIAGLRRARGRVQLDDERWLDSSVGRNLAPEERSVGYVPQDGLLFPHWSVRKNLLSGARRARRAGRDPLELVERAARAFQLDPLLEREPNTLSGGERQRVALARALCSAPRLLLLDEPLAGLDLPLRRRLLPFLLGIPTEFGVPTVLVSHDPTEVQALCDDLVLMTSGAVTARGAPREVLSNPQHFELGPDHGFENVLPCAVGHVGPGGTRVELEGGATLSTRPASKAEVGAPAYVTINARDIIVATHRPEGLSARNVLEARIVSLEESPGGRMLRAATAPRATPIAVELSGAACDELGLDASEHVFLIVKSSACTLLGAAERLDTGYT